MERITDALRSACSNSRQAYTDASSSPELLSVSGYGECQQVHTKAPKKSDAQSKDLDAPHKDTYNHFWPLADEDREPAAKVALVSIQDHVKPNMSCAPQAPSSASSRCHREASANFARARNILSDAGDAPVTRVGASCEAYGAHMKAHIAPAHVPSVGASTQPCVHRFLASGVYGSRGPAAAVSS